MAWLWRGYLEVATFVGVLFSYLEWILGPYVESNGTEPNGICLYVVESNFTFFHVIVF